MLLLAPLLLPLLLACAGPGGGAGTPTDGGAADTAQDSGAGPFVHQLSYALIADPHITGPGDHLDRLQQAIDWVNTNHKARDIQLVFILGDIAWGDGFDDALASLDTLQPTWVPIIGDNPIQVGDEALVASTFGPHLDALGGVLDGWHRAPEPVDDPDIGAPAHLLNHAFDLGGLHFICLDWNSRQIDPLWGETPDLHDFPGGTFPFLQDELAAVQATAPDGPQERVVLLTHMPMLQGPGFFDDAEGSKLVALLGPVADTVQGDHAGHLHGNGEQEWPETGLLVDTTDATWDDVVSVRVIDISLASRGYRYQSEVVELP